MARAKLPAIAAGEGGLSRYLAEIRQFPMLAPDEEYMLAKAGASMATATPRTGW